jgi:hypothetical protein
VRGLGDETRLGPILRGGALGVGYAVEFGFEWTEATSHAQLGDAKLVKSVAFPPGVTALGERALYEFRALKLMVPPASCIDIGDFAFAHCAALKTFTLPFGWKATGFHAFRE